MGIGGELTGAVEQLLVQRVLASGHLFRMIGPASHAHKAEVEIEAAYPGMRCLLLPSSTLGLMLLLEALGLRPGQEVLIEPLGWVSNWSCLRRAGLKPRFLALDERLQVQPQDVAARIGPQTGAVIITHLLGRGQQGVIEISRICRERGIPLLEDVAQSFGVSIQGRRAGAFGDGAWCSLNHHKILSTGDGGFVLVRDPALFDQVAARHDQGHSVRGGKRNPLPEPPPGLSLRVNEVTAAVLRGQLARYPLVRARIQALHDLVEAECRNVLGLRTFDAFPGDIPFATFFTRPSGMRYPTLADAGWHVASNVPWLTAELGPQADEPNLRETFRRLQQISVIGSGFVDRYHGMPLGIRITDTAEESRRMLDSLRDLL